MGHFVTKEGLMPDDHKIDAIVNMPPPIDVPSLQRFLGMTKYLSQYTVYQMNLLSQPLCVNF